MGNRTLEKKREKNNTQNELEAKQLVAKVTALQRASIRRI